MRRALHAKITSHPELQMFLLSTGNAPILEVSRRDTFWGSGGSGKGENHLGLLLMEVRDALLGAQPLTCWWIRRLDPELGWVLFRHGTLVRVEEPTDAILDQATTYLCDAVAAMSIERVPPPDPDISFKPRHSPGSAGPWATRELVYRMGPLVQIRIPREPAGSGARVPPERARAGGDPLTLARERIRADALEPLPVQIMWPRGHPAVPWQDERV